MSSAWGNVHPEFFAPLLSGVPRVGADWQVAIYERGLVPVVQFRLELADGGPRDAVVDAVLSALQRVYSDAWVAYCQRLIDVEFAFFAPGTIRRTRKLLRVVDERGVPPPQWDRAPVVAARR